ncbi:MAG TPA: cytochrome P450 [Kofleriaceae bacterium]|nr:cytochrome P450 [Kofleriaceae bacterium]
MVTTSSPLIAPREIPDSIPAVPGLPVIGNLLAFRRDRLALHAEAARLGPIARVSLAHIPLYIATCGELAHEVLVTQAARFKKSAGLHFLRPLLGDGLLTAEGEPHRRHRKLLAPAFAPRRIASYGEIMVSEVIEQLGKWSPGDRVDLAAEMMEMTLAIAGRTLFGVDVRRDASTVARALDLAMRAMVDNLTSPIQLDYRWPLPRHLRMRRAVKLLDDVVYRLIARGRALGTDRGDVLSMLLVARDEDDGTGLSDLQVRDEVMTLLLAGHETTANTLTWTWYELGKHPEVVARLEAEVQRVVGARRVTADDLPELPWTAAVIDEAMRLHPPAYIVAREAIADIELAGHRLPERSMVAVNIHGIHRRADYYPDPLVFRPERMLAEARKARPRHHYLPFGAGPRVCIGAHFALVEAQLALATLAQHARIHPLRSSVEPEPMVTLRPRGGMPAIIERC